MRAGKLNRLLAFQRPTSVEDAAGQPRPDWEPVDALWADVRSLSGLATLRAGAETSIVRASIRVRHDERLVAGMRAVAEDDGTTYHITARLPDQSNRRYTDLVAEVRT